MKKAKSLLSTVSEELFQVSIVLYLILLLAETVKAGFVSNFFNLNILLWIVLISGVGMILTGVEKSNSKTLTDRTWGYFLKKVTLKSNSLWNNLLRQLLAKKLAQEDWKKLYQDWYKHSSGRYYWGVLEDDWRVFLKDLKKNHIREKDLYFILIVSLGGGFLVYYKTQQLGRIALFISVVTTVIILLLSFLIFTEEDKP